MVELLRKELNFRMICVKFQNAMCFFLDVLTERFKANVIVGAANNSEENSNTRAELQFV